MSIKKAIVTGGSRGIGRGIAIKLAENGYDVAISYASASGAAEAVKEKIEAMGRKCYVYKVDLSDCSQAQPFIRQAAKDLGGLDLLVNNAGLTLTGHIAEMPVKMIDTLINLDFKSYLLCTQTAARHMVKRGVKGNIINITSSRGERAYPNDAIYGGVKAALNRAVQSMALDLAPYGIRINNVAPGATQIRTKEEMEETYKEWRANGWTGEAEEEPYAELAGRIPLERVGTPEDIAEAILYLTSEKASYVTGITLRVDGGLILAGMPERMPPEGMLTYDMMWGGGEKKAIEFTDED